MTGGAFDGARFTHTYTPRGDTTQVDLEGEFPAMPGMSEADRTADDRRVLHNGVRRGHGDAAPVVAGARARGTGRVTARVLILGAGFGGLELGTRLSEALGDTVDVTLIDRNDAFVFGFSKLDVMFGGATLDQVRLPYRTLREAGRALLRQTITSIDPERRRVTTDAGVFDADYLVVALGAALDIAATPGLAERGNEFYSVAGAARLREVLPDFTRGHAIVGACSAPYKCPRRRARRRSCSTIT